MKRRLLIGTALTMTVFSAPVAMAVTGPAAISTGAAAGQLNSTVDNIAVPESVLEDVQLTFQGYAVTHAVRLVRNDGITYRLQVSRDSSAAASNSLYLLYDQAWQMRGTEQPPAPASTAPSDSPKGFRNSEDKPAKPKKSKHRKDD